MSESRRVIERDRAPEAVGPYPHARRVGNLLFLSGIGPRERGASAIPGVILDAEGRKAGRDIEAQCRSVFDNVRIVLEDSGSSWHDIVDVTVFLTHMDEDFATYNRSTRSTSATCARRAPRSASAPCPRPSTSSSR